MKWISSKEKLPEIKYHNESTGYSKVCKVKLEGEDEVMIGYYAVENLGPDKESNVGWYIGIFPEDRYLDDGIVTHWKYLTEEN